MNRVERRSIDSHPIQYQICRNRLIKEDEEFFGLYDNNSGNRICKKTVNAINNS